MLFALIAFGAIGIYLSVFSGIFVAFFLTFVFLYTRYKYTFSLKVDNVIAKELLIFSSKNYLANFINALPMQLLPIIVLNRLGPKYAAYYYIATMVANTIYIIPSAISRSFFAEGAHNEAELKKLMFKAAKMIIIFLVPAVFAIVFLGKYILLAFGKQFSDEAFTLLQLFALTALLLPINSIGSTILNIKGKMGLLTVLCVMNALIILVPVYLLPQVTLLSIGYVWLISHVVIALLTVLFMYFYFYRKQ
jgi:O-antigen/teichoic acid export membrane protein